MPSYVDIHLSAVQWTVWMRSNLEIINQQTGNRWLWADRYSGPSPGERSLPVRPIHIRHTDRYKYTYTQDTDSHFFDLNDSRGAECSSHSVDHVSSTIFHRPCSIDHIPSRVFTLVPRQLDQQAPVELYSAFRHIRLAYTSIRLLDIIRFMNISNLPYQVNWTSPIALDAVQLLK